MKKLSVLVLLLFVGFGVFAQESEGAENAEGPVIAFEESKHDFGDITQGEKVEHTFDFENSGTMPLILSNVAVTCGCTATEWPRDPVPPGEKGSITVQFNSAGKMGRQNKVITIYSNATMPIERVYIVTNVLPKKKVN